MLKAPALTLVLSVALTLPAPAAAPGDGSIPIPPATARLTTADVTTWSLDPNASTGAAAESVSDDPVVRGRYLATAGNCVDCHTNAGGAPFAGGRPIVTPFGTIYSSNITPDPETGLGGVGADQFYRAMHEGVGHRGEPLYPAFPYPYFTRLTRQDADAIHAYLATVAPVRQAKPPNRLPFPVNLRAILLLWKALFFHPATFAPDPAQSAARNRGAYLVTGPGHCGACHTPKNLLGADENRRALQGGRIDDWAAVSLAGDLGDGLGSWSQDDVVQFLRTGRNARASASGSMTEVIYFSTSRLSDADLAAIAVYLKSLPPSGRGPPLGAPSPAALAAGAAVYADACSGCHRANGEGQPGTFPPLQGNAQLQAHDPTTVIRIILEGARATPTPGRPTPLAMPAFGFKLTDQQVADVATYARASWGNAAAPVSAAQVDGLRRRLARADD